MKLFYLPGACSLAPHILMRELRFPVELVRMSRTDKGPLLKYNPKGHVPTLVLDNGQVLTEAAVILQYLADQKPEANLIPKAGTMERYKVQEWLNYVATELHKSFNPLFSMKAQLEEKALDLFREKIKKEVMFLDQHFAKNKFLTGDKMSVADIYAYVVLSWSQFVKIDLTTASHLMSFMEKIGSLPSTKEATAAEQATK